MNRLLFFMASFISLNLFGINIELPAPVKFRTKEIAGIISWLDGKKNLIDGIAVKDLNKVIYQLHVLQYGLENTKTKKKIGKYIIQNKRYTIGDLARMERENKLPFKDQREEEETLKEACKDFGKIVEPFENRVKGLKHFLTELIIESCSIRGKMDSPLLDWSKCKGNEAAVFEHRILSAGKSKNGFQLINRFFGDLVTFFVDIQFNCPKACQQYEKLKHRSEEETYQIYDGKDNWDS